MPSRPKIGGGARHGATDFFQLSLAYAKQEALQPITRQAKTLGKGVAGAFLMALGAPLLALGFVRALQTEFGSRSAGALVAYAPLTQGSKTTLMPRALANRLAYDQAYGVGGHLSGNWSWVPYMGGALVCLLVAGFCVTRVLRKP